MKPNLNTEIKQPTKYQYQCLGECRSKLFAPMPIIACFHCGGRVIPVPLENKSGVKPPTGGI